MHRIGAPARASSHQFGAEPGLPNPQAFYEGVIGSIEPAALALDSELDVAAPLRMVHARQAEHLDAREFAFDRLHERRQRRFHRAEYDDRALAGLVRLVQM